MPLAGPSSRIKEQLKFLVVEVLLWALRHSASAQSIELEWNLLHAVQAARSGEGGLEQIRRIS